MEIRRLKTSLEFFCLLLLACGKVSIACTKNQYRKTLLNGKVECVDCPRCPVGFGLLVECGSNLTAYDKIDCQPCKETEFSASYDYEQCKPCSVCSKDQVMTPCTTHSNTVCYKRCISKQNYYEKSSDDCQECSWCCGDADDIIESECLRKGMPKQKSCTAHRKKKCTPAPSTQASAHSTTVKPLTQFPLTNTTSQPSTIKYLKTTLMPSNPTTHSFKTTGKRGDWQEDNPNIILTIVLGCLAGIFLAVVIFCCGCYYKKRRSPPNSTEQLVVQVDDGNGTSTATSDEVTMQLLGTNATTSDEVTTQLVAPVDDGNSIGTGNTSDELNTQLRAGTGKKLFQIFRENYDLEDKVCVKLDCHKSYIKVAEHYAMDRDHVKKLRERPGDNPTQEILDFVESLFPSLLVTEFIACTNEIGRRDVSEVLMPHI